MLQLIPRFIVNKLACTTAVPHDVIHVISHKLFSAQPLHFCVPLVAPDHCIRTPVAASTALLPAVEPPSVGVRVLVFRRVKRDHNLATMIPPDSAGKPPLRTRAKMFHADAVPFVSPLRRRPVVGGPEPFPPGPFSIGCCLTQGARLGRNLTGRELWGE